MLHLHILTARRLMAFCLLTVAALMLPAAANATTPDLIPCFAPVQPGDTFALVLSTPKRFNCPMSQNKMKPGDYWVRMDVPLATQKAAGPRPILRIASLWDDGMTLATVHQGGLVTEYGSDVMKKTLKHRLGATSVLPLDTGKPPITTLIARVNGSLIIRGVLVAPKLTSGEEAIRFAMGMAVLYAGFGGLCIAMLVYNLALWRAMREKFLLAYCAMVTAMMAYAFFTSGGIHYLVDDMTGGDRLRITIPLLTLSAATALIFIRSFFEDSKIPLWLRRATVVQAVGMVGFALAFSMSPSAYVPMFDSVYVLSFLPAPLIFCAYIWMAWRQNNPYCWYFLAAWAVPLTAFAARMLYSFGLMPFSVLNESSTLIGFAFEALISSLAISERVRMLSKARHRAEAAEASAMLMADTDPLTGLLNRRAFLRSLLERKNHWTLVLLDIDHFKRVNDSLGHVGGDDAITHIAAVMLENAPDGALVARMGGEEFAICYRTIAGHIFDADKLLSSVRAIGLPHGFRMTASIGVADRQVDDENDWKILYRAADMALFRAKSAGRDCFIHSDADRAAA